MHSRFRVDITDSYIFYDTNQGVNTHLSIRDQIYILHTSQTTPEQKTSNELKDNSVITKCLFSTGKGYIFLWNTHLNVRNVRLTLCNTLPQAA